jgi:hypothetical protein
VDRRFLYWDAFDSRGDANSMSQSGEVIFYQQTWRLDDSQALDSLLRLSGSSTCVELYRTLEEDRTWLLYQEDSDSPFPDEELVGEEVELAEIPNFVTDDRFIRISFGNSPLLAQVREAIIRTIPAKILGRYVPTELSVVVGYHDLVATDQYPELRLIARPPLSVHFAGYGVPSDCDAFAELVFTVPEVLSVKQRLESVVGNVQGDCLWIL